MTSVSQQALVSSYARNIKLTWINQGDIATDGATFNFGNFVIPRPGLVIVTGAVRGDSGGQNISSITIGGVAGSVLADAAISTNNEMLFAARELPAGTYNVTMNCTGSVRRGSCDVWLLEDYQSSVPTAALIVHNAGSVVAISTGAFNIPADGVGIYFAFHASANPTGVVWSTAVERSDRTNEIRFSGAELLNPTSAPVSGAQTATFTGATANTCVIGYLAFN
jgi:hypothetical protein